MDIENIALSGGGVKGYAYIGLIKKLEEQNIKIKRVSGTSIGSMIGLMLCLGYNSNEMENIAINLNFEMLQEIDISLIFKEYGINSGKKMTTFINYIVKHKGYHPDLTFIQLYKACGIHLFITCCDIETYEQKVFDYTRTPEFKVSSACKYSMAVPLIWTMSETKYVDGCLARNIPVELLPIEKTLGFYFKNTRSVSPIHDLNSYIKNIMNCSINKGNSLEIEKYKLLGYDMRYIQTNVSASDANISLEEKIELISSGYKSFYSKPDLENYQFA